MRLLLDTHVVVWAATRPDRLSERARAAIRDVENERLVSAVSIYEIIYKRGVSQGLGVLPDDVIQLADPLVLSWLAVDEHHADRAARLPLRHRDPWDRMIVAQALIDDLTLVTADRALKGYGVPILW
ncbi:type II toxin-antitoxin system VapC family toxin [Brevundimonas balnearis]|uniref:Type II toxin-antitoxin system VapC family toxin n=1 Tax=Brevundimonas balnearis TaxID=1572858 RepID=A0ABV6R1K2_9CAUL